MIPYDDALTQLLAAVMPLHGERRSLEGAAGRYLAEPVIAAIDAPRQDVSAMDGYAVRLAEAQGGGWLDVVGKATPGAPYPGKLALGQAVRIFTGAPVPPGADCVVIQEETSRDGDRVHCRDGFGPGRHIRTCGSDFRAGDTLLLAGTFLSPTAVVALAGADRADVLVSRQPRIAIIATGDELVDPGSAATSAHSIPESGSFGVAALAAASGAMLAGRLRGKDRLDELEDLAAQALAMADCVVVIGGASVGDHDLARPMFDRLGLSLTFAKVAIKPGKPVWFGTAHGKPILGLPGNPGSAMVTARLFLAPLLAAMQGGDGRACVATSPQRIAANLAASGSRETFTRARMNASGLIPVSNQESGAQAPLAQSDWLIRRAPNDGAVAEGAMVRAMPF